MLDCCSKTRGEVSDSIVSIRSIDFENEIELNDPSDKLVESAALENSLDIKVFPNPNGGRFTILVKNATDQEATLKIYNIFGKLIYSDPSAMSEHYEVDISSHSKGIYIAKIRQGDNVTTKKIVYQ